MRSQEFTGKTTQEAIDAGLAAFGVTIADVHVDVLQEGAKGLFGLFGSKPARVRMTVMEEDREDDHGLSDLLGSFSLNEPAQQRKKKPAAPKQDAPKAEAVKKDAPKTEAAKQAAPKTEAAKQAAPKAETAKKDAPKAEPAKQAAPKAEAVKKDAPKPAAKQDAPAAGDKAEEAASDTAKAEKPRKPRPKKKAEPRPAQEDNEPRDYQPMEPAQPFTPTEPPVMHPEDTAAGRAQRFLMDVTDRMGVKVDVYVDDSREDNLYIHMVGDTLGILIGRRGETLDALQYLTSLKVNKGREGYIRVTLDTENYRAKREDSLRRLAQRMANRAQKTGRRVVLEPMNPYERRVLHTALQNHPAVTTHSEGEEPNRRVVIMLAGQPEKAEKADKGDRTERAEGKPSSRRSRSRRRGRRGPKPEAAAAAETAEVTAAPETPVDVLGGEE